MGKDILIKIIGDSVSADHAFKSTADHADNTGGKLSKVSKVAGIAGAAIGGGLVFALKKSVDAAKESEISQTKMESALKAVGVSYDAHKGKIEDVIQSTSKLAALDDEDLQDSFTKLVRTTGDVNKSLTDTQLAANVARGANISLEAATKAITGAELGRDTALKKLGISVPKVTASTDEMKKAFESYKETHKKLAPEEEAHWKRLLESAKATDKNKTAQDALALATQKYSGAAEAYGKTAAGSQERFGVALENVEESLGKALLPALTKVFTEVAKGTEFLSAHEGITKLLVVAVGALAGVLLAVSVATKAYEVGTTIAGAASKVFAAAQWLVNAALTANPIGIVVVALAALVAAFVIAYKNSETFRDIVDGVFGDVRKVAVGFVNFFTDTVPDAFIRVKNWTKEHWPEIAVIISGPFAPLVALATDGFGVRSHLIEAFDKTRDRVKEIMGDVVDFFRDLPGKLGGFAASAGGAVKGAFISAVGDLSGSLSRMLKAALNSLIATWNNIKIPSFHIHFGKSVFGHFVGVDFDTPDINFPNIPFLAKGGIALGPTLAMVGDGGPEAIVPLDRGGFGGGVTHIHVGEGGTFYGGDKQRIAQELAEEIARALRDRGRLGSRLGLSVAT